MTEAFNAAPKQVVLVSKKWNNPTIAVGISPDGISIQMPMTQFLDSLVANVGNPTFLLTTAALRVSLQVAADKIQQEMQAATAQAMAAASAG